MSPPPYFSSNTQYVWNEHVHITGRSRDHNTVFRYLFVRIKPGEYSARHLLSLMLQAIDTRRAMITHRADWPWYGGIYWIATFYPYETADGNINEIYARFREEVYDTYRAWQNTGYDQGAGPPRHFMPQRRPGHQQQPSLQPWENYQGVMQPQRRRRQNYDIIDDYRDYRHGRHGRSRRY